MKLSLLLCTLIVQNLLFIGLTLIFWRKQGIDWVEAGLMKPSRRMVLLAILAGCLTSLCLHVCGAFELCVLERMIGSAEVTRLQHQWQAAGAEQLFLQLRTPWAKFSFMACGVVIAPLGEEFLFRGAVFYVLLKRLQVGNGGALVATIISSLLFAIAHLNPITGLPLFLMGAGLSYSYLKTRNLWVPFIVHAMSNLGTFIMLLLFYTKHA